MDVKKLILGMVGIMICAVMIGGALLPIVADVTADSDTFENDGYYTMDVVTGDYFMNWSASDKDVILINDGAFNLSTLERGRDYTIFATDNMIVRVTPSNDVNYIYFTSYGGDTGYWRVQSNYVTDYFDLSVSEGVVSVSYSYNGEESTKTYPVANEIYAINPTGNGILTMKKASSSAYVLESSSIILLAGNTKVGTIDVSILAKGTINDLDFDVVNGNLSEPTFTNVVASFDESTNHVDLVSLDKVSFTVATNNGQSTNAEYTYFLVPTEVTAERIQSLNEMSGGLFNVLPLVVIAGLVLVGIYVFISRK